MRIETDRVAVGSLVREAITKIREEERKIQDSRWLADIPEMRRIIANAGDRIDELTNSVVNLVLNQHDRLVAIADRVEMEESLLSPTRLTNDLREIIRGTNETGGDRHGDETDTEQAGLSAESGGIRDSGGGKET